MSLLFQSVRIYYLRQEMILKYMKSLVVPAVTGNSGAHYLSKSVDVIGLYIKSLFYLITHRIRPGLRSADGALKLYLIHKILFLQGFRHMEKIGRSAGYCRYLAVYHHVYQLFGVAC